VRAVRYVELNPVRSGLVSAACDWPRSSARAHTDSTCGDPLLDVSWAECFNGCNFAEWRENSYRASSAAPDNGFAY